MQVDERNFIAVLDYHEDSPSVLTPGEILEREFGWLEQSGIALSNWALVDHDVRWERYIMFLVQWAIDHNSDEYEGMSPPCYEEWCHNEDHAGVV